jgi:hypothetical protein
MNGQRQPAYTPRPNRRLTIDGTPVNSKYFTVRSEGAEIAAKTGRVQGKGEQRVGDLWTHQN